MKLKDVLRKKSVAVITITPDQTLLQASQLLNQHKIGAVVVVDDDGAPMGILSERDIVRELATLGGDVTQRTTRDAMTQDIIVGYLDDDLSYASSIMTDKRIRHLPIVDGDDDKLVGIVSIGDVVKTQLAYVEVEAHMLRQYVTSA